MITEVALLSIREGEGDEFEAAFETASSIISTMPGYLEHELQRYRGSRALRAPRAMGEARGPYRRVSPV